VPDRDAPTIGVRARGGLPVPGRVRIAFIPPRG
jgi:hypothetical protein